MAAICSMQKPSQLNDSLHSVDLTFNIIYTTMTVHHLLPFVSTFLEYTNCKFRLVDNGCTSEEHQILEAFCRQSDRLSFYSFNSANVIPHGQALSQLQEMETSDYFAFMDSDIFATGIFLESHLQSLQEHIAICSCLPIWHSQNEVEMRENFTIMGGCFLKTHNHHFLGVSYYAIYRNHQLTEAIRATGISFSSYHWPQIPNPHQQTLQRLGLQKNFYDTGKVLNILLQQRGETITYQPTPHLVHIGAFSGLSLQYKSEYYKLRNYMLQHLPSPVRMYLRRLRHPAYQIMSAIEQADLDFRTVRRRSTTQYLSHLLTLSSEEKGEQYLQPLPLELQAQIKHLGQQCLEIHKQYSK